MVSGWTSTVGGEFTKTEAVSTGLSNTPSVTTRLSTYVPSRSGTKDGVPVCALTSETFVTWLDEGTVRKYHANVRASPSGSLLALPSSVTARPTNTCRSGPASARGALSDTAWMRRPVLDKAWVIP